ncbi:MAG: ABC transporter permease [Gaiellaceae bacterium MAG52_C11]|nr:ABC transporter permease [Candidatus Gaiellasilicea maunaloa]
MSATKDHATGAASEDSEPLEIPNRGPWGHVWTHLRQDRVAFLSGCVFAAIVFLCFLGAPLLAWLLGHGPNDPFPYAVNDELRPIGPLSSVPDVNEFVDIDESTPRTFLLFGADGSLGRDLFLRVLYGGQTSLQVGLGATALAMLIGVPIGMLSGFLGGWPDRGISWVTELFMGFPLLLFLVAIGYTVAPRFNDVTLGGAFQPGVLVLVFLIGIFSWFYPARIIRAQVLALRETEFLEAARMIGASDWRILRTHVLPHVLAPVIVWSTLITAGFIVFESAISILNVGLELPTASWGSLLAANWGTLLVFDPLATDQQAGFYVDESNWVLFFPSAALFLTIVSLALFGEGLRRAVDPKGIE